MQDFLSKRSLSFETTDGRRGRQAHHHASTASTIVGVRRAEAHRDARRRSAIRRRPSATDVNVPMLILLVFIQVIYVTMVYGPIAAFLVELFPTRIRYTSMSLPYHIGNGWFGGMLPLTAAALVAANGNIYAGLWYPVIVAGVTLRDRRALHPRDARPPHQHAVTGKPATAPSIRLAADREYSRAARPHPSIGERLFNRRSLFPLEASMRHPSCWHLLFAIFTATVASCGFSAQTNLDLGPHDAASGGSGGGAGERATPGARRIARRDRGGGGSAGDASPPAPPAATTARRAARTRTRTAAPCRAGPRWSPRTSSSCRIARCR